MINLDLFTNTTELSKKEFQKLVESPEILVFTKSEISKFVEDTTSTFEKSENAASLQDKLKTELSGLKKILVIGDDLQKSEVYVLKGTKTDDIEKGKKATVGEIRDWNGKKYRKQPNGKWLEVSESHGMTSSQHLRESERIKRTEPKGLDKVEFHKVKGYSLSDKEHTDEEVGLKKEKKNSEKNVSKIKEGISVKIPRNLTTDPAKKQGESGVVSSVTKDTVAVQFKDGKTGHYDISVFEDPSTILSTSKGIKKSQKKIAKSFRDKDYTKGDLEKACMGKYPHFSKAEVDKFTEKVDKKIKKYLEKAKNKTNFSTEERTELAKKGQALPDGSFPIRNRQDLKDAIKSIGLAKDKSEAKSWIKKRAKELDLESLLPKKWMKSEIEKSEDGDFYYNFFKEESPEEIQKSIVDDLSYSSDFRVEKKGSEVKEKLGDLLKVGVEESTQLYSQLQAKLQSCGTEPKQDCDFYPVQDFIKILPELPKIYNWEEYHKCDTSKVEEPLLDTTKKEETPEVLTPEICQCRREYNDLVSKYTRQLVDNAEMETILRSFKDASIYKLSIRQATILGF